jgi:nicotinate dehydrogenase subunit A
MRTIWGKEEAMAGTIDLTVNGRRESVAADPQTPLLTVLRNDLGLHGPKFGCGLGQCGACTVHMDGTAIRSCATPVASARGTRITTIEGLAQAGTLHAVQQAFIDEQAAQCGYCINGWIMTAAALLEADPRASEEDIRKGLAGLKCRCGTHMSILRAVRLAQSRLAAGHKA